MAAGQRVSVFLKPSGYTGTTPRGGEPGSNGLLMDTQGRLVLCQHGDRRVARLEAGGTFTTLADRYNGKRFNSPNDGVFKSNGDLYFTDPPYGLVGLNADPAKELDFNGVYRISASDGKVTLLTREMTFPNGIAFSPDEKTLYVANSDPKKAIWMAFPVQDDGTLGAGRVFGDVTSSVGSKTGLARWDESGSGRQPVRNRARRRTDLRCRRHPPGHLRHRPGDCQLRLGRRRHGPLHHGRHVPGTDQADHQGTWILNAARARDVALGHE